MKKKYFCTAFAAALLFAGFAFTACDDDGVSFPGKPFVTGLFKDVLQQKGGIE